MILSFINIRNVPLEVLKTSDFALGYQQLPQDLAIVNEWKIMFDPYNEQPSQLMRLWFMYLLHRQQLKAQVSLHIRVVLPEPSLFAHDVWK